MIEIISGPVNCRRREFTCFNCGTIFQADRWDYIFCDEQGKEGYQIACPTCGDNTWHHRYNPGSAEWTINLGYKGVKDIN